jgi:hypothetical protein
MGRGPILEGVEVAPIGPSMPIWVSRLAANVGYSRVPGLADRRVGARIPAPRVIFLLGGGTGAVQMSLGGAGTHVRSTTNFSAFDFISAPAVANLKRPLRPFSKMWTA